MMLLLLPVGLLLPTLCGWFAINVVEREHPVLQPFERWTLSMVFGITLTMYLSFLGEVFELIDFTFTGLLGVQIFTTLALGLLWMHCTVQWTSPLPPPLPAPSPRLSRRKCTIVILLCAWTVLKLAGGFLELTATPPYENDVFSNWNMRGKTFFVTHEFTLEDETGEEVQETGGVSSYPPTVPLFKTWLALLAQSWDEGLVNSIHFVWFLAALSLVYFMLRRSMSVPWSLAGTYVLSSLPLYFLHGTVAYADVFLSVHIFATLSLLHGALLCEEPAHRKSFLRLCGLSVALLIFTKNEALILHLPVFALVALLALRSLSKSGALERSEIRAAVRHGLVLVGIVLLPWVLYKWTHNLTFGNAKSILNLTMAWQEGVARAIAINTFLEGNWALLPPLLLGLIAVQWREAFRFPTALFTVFILMIVLGQFPLYFFTGLSTEALNQTGYARGLVQLAPTAVALMMTLAHSLARRSFGTGDSLAQLRGNDEE